MKYNNSYFKKIILVFFLAFASIKIFGLYIIRDPFETSSYARGLIQIQFQNLLHDYLKHEMKSQIPDSLYEHISLIFKYNPEGRLSEIRDINVGRPCQIFTEQDLVKVFDYFKDLPPFEIPNTTDKLWSDWEGKYIYKDTIKRNYYDYLKIGGYTIFFGKANTYLANYTDSGFMFVDIRTVLGKIGKDTVFGDMNWVEVKKQYYASGVDEDDYFEKKEIKKDDMSKEGYYWTKIPINKYNVNIQIPDSSKIELSPDASSANVYFPDSSYLYINFSRDKINDFNPSKYNYSFFDKIIDMKVNDKYILSEGNEDIDDGKEYFARIWFRHGITATVYTDEHLKLLSFIRYTLETITTTIRP